MNMPAGFPAMSNLQAHQLICAPGTMLEIGDAVIDGIPMRVYKNAPPNLRQLLQFARMYGNRDYLVLDDERVTFNGFVNATATLAKILTDTYGIQKGDRVAVIMRNLPELPVIFFAVVSIGAVICPINAWWTAEEIAYGMEDSGARMVFIDGERLARCADINALSSAETIIACRPRTADAQNFTTLESLIGPSNDWATMSAPPLPEVEILPEDPATLFYTSGTTGKPKGALGSHRNCITNLMNLMVHGARQYLRRGEKPPEPDPSAPQKAGLLAIPLFHVTATHAVMVPAIAQGIKLVMMRKWDATEGLRLIQDEKITSFGGVPAIAWQVLEHPDFDKYDTSTVESVGYGGAPSSAELVRRIKQAFPKTGQPGQGYGLTETSAAVTNIAAEDYLLRPTSCGVIHPVNDVRIVGADGQDMPVGDVGEIWIKGPNVIKGYWNKPDATKEAFVDGWFKSGDLGKFDEEGFLYIVDRAKDMIIRGGENVYCVEIEDVLYQHPEISDAAIVGVPHRILGEEVGAVVCVPPNSTITETDVQDWVREKLASFKVPAYVKIFHEPLVRNANGKILKTALKALFVDQ